MQYEQYQRIALAARHAQAREMGRYAGMAVRALGRLLRWAWRAAVKGASRLAQRTTQRRLAAAP
jgi:hypothetical protein